ncbi:RNA/RNP complex-1-interacting phosphatase [Drosophila biarmipes]|uniref:RNA/RNP complex-1-interacting phosphatase n=1 Tax=Drosophila biarmipes TaxID=125945 RepID=UPI0007E70171|nr:RNA/RNP complex-1-interacting phosphatase [Drosophila biarmipes]
MAKAIPDRWLNYKPIGKRIPGTRFIAFKVPLRQHVNARVEEHLRLAPESLLESVPDLGLIIDLTNTNRYYHPSALTEHDVRHQKLMIPGKKTPPRKLAEKFCGFVADFLESNADNDKLIGVHCTHGVNRTGYLICYFMITVLNKSPEEAIKNFAAARGHDIERTNYLSALNTLSANDPPVPKEPSIEEDHNGYGYTSRHHANTEYNDYRQQDRHYQRGGGFYRKPNYRDKDYGSFDNSNWRSGNSRNYSNYSRDNEWSNRDQQSYYKNSRDWQKSRKIYSRADDDHKNGWPYSRNHRQDREYRQETSYQNNKSAGTYHQHNWRGYQNHYQNSERVDSRRYSTRNYNDEE